MSEYVEVFRVEAKSLLKNFQKHEKEAVARCDRVFGDRQDVSLMNMQHVVAKEYGFDSWNELVKAERWQLAEALIATKNKTLHTPLSVDGRKGAMYPFADGKGTVGLRREREGVDLVNFQRIYANGSTSPYLPLDAMDLSQYDLSKLNVLRADYDAYTLWPAEAAKRPEGFEPAEFLEKRKNPGLGIRALHKQGIDGRNRAAAVIDGFLLCDHLEYHDNLKWYERVDSGEPRHGVSGGELVSALAGKTCGVAPKADIYYFSALQTENKQRTLRYYAQALEKICDLHEERLKEGKSGIDVVCILWGIVSELFQNDDGAAEMQAAVKRAADLGVWVNSGHLDFAGNKLWRESRVCCKADGDLDNPDDYTVMPNQLDMAKFPELVRNTLCFPGGGRTVAGSVRLDAYRFSAPGFSLKPYECGLFVLARSVKPDLTAEEFWRIGLETGDFRDGIGVIVNPRQLVTALRG